MSHQFTQSKKGFALLLVLIISSVVLAIGVSILRVSVNQLNLSSTARESEISFQNAHAGLDCVQYWRNTDADNFVPSSVSSAPSIECFDTTPISSSFNKVTTSNGYANTFSYTFEWGEDFLRCSDMTLWIMNATEDDFPLTFSDYPTIGIDGTKTCLEENVCTVIFSRGYNRSCDDLDSSIFSVQREIVLEY